MKHIIFLAITAGVFALVSCGGGGGGAGGQSPAPIVTNLRYTPESTTASSADIAVSGSLKFTSSVDLVSLKISDSDGNTSISPISGISGLRSGTISVPSASVKGAPARNYTFNISLVDSNGSESNKLVGQIVISRAPLLANAGFDKAIYANSVTLLAGETTNENGTPTNYLWTLTNSSTGANGSLTNSTSKTASFTPTSTGVFSVGFQISDGTDFSTVDKARITALPNGKFSLFSSTANLISTQGAANSVLNWFAGVTRYTYGNILTYVEINNSCECVVGWSNDNGTLNAIMLPATWVTNGQTYISLTSTFDDVVRIQGTPIKYSYSAWQGHQLVYDNIGLTYVEVSGATGLVTGWSNDNKSLKLTP